MRFQLQWLMCSWSITGALVKALAKGHTALKEDLQLIYNMIKSKVPEKFIVLYGRSLGSGFATKLASANNLDFSYWMLPTTVSAMLPKDTFFYAYCMGHSFSNSYIQVVEIC